jgi:hypothetical protein
MAYLVVVMSMSKQVTLIFFVIEAGLHMIIPIDPLFIGGKY